MEISGNGKTVIGQLLDKRLHLLFWDADDFLSLTNKELHTDWQ